MTAIRHIPKPLAIVALVTAVTISSAMPSLARGGDANILNSPGYQRALQEEHKALLRAAQPTVIETRTAYRHRHRRHGH